MSDLHLALTASKVTDFYQTSKIDLGWTNTVLPSDLLSEAQTEIASWPKYEPTPLTSLKQVADLSGVGHVSYKDESPRFGLSSFKALGGAFAVLKLLSSKLGVPMSEIRAGQHKEAAANICVATATDGNHGRSVSWGAQQAGCQCKIYIHAEVSEGRQKAMEEFGADVVRIDGDYDESVRLCAEQSAQNGWFVVSDTSYEGYTEVPAWVMAGYSLMGQECVDQAPTPITHVIVQAGVGGMAAGFISGLMDGLIEAADQDKPKILVVETDMAPCLIESMRSQKPVNVRIDEETMMAGLSCGEPSLLALQVLGAYAQFYMTIPDDGVAATMRALGKKQAADVAVEAGECSATGILALMAASKDADLKAKLGLDEKSHVLVIGTEGATDREIYDQLMNGEVV